MAKLKFVLLISFAVVVWVGWNDPLPCQQDEKHPLTDRSELIIEIETNKINCVAWDDICRLPLETQATPV